MEKLFNTDEISKRERVERALNGLPLDRAPLHDQLSYNPQVIAQATGKPIEGFNYTVEDIGETVRKNLDATFPLRAPRGKERYTYEDGTIMQNDEWTTWIVKHPCDTEEEARDWAQGKIQYFRQLKVDPNQARQAYRDEVLSMQRLIGETVLIMFSTTGFCEFYSGLGLQLFTFFYEEYPDLMTDFMEARTSFEIQRVNAVADLELSPVILIAEDFATKQGPIFNPDFLRKHHYPYVKRLAEAWHNHGYKVLYHSDGNYKKAIPDLLECGVDGFYCLEPACGMDVVELKQTWGDVLWAGGVDGVDLMERGNPEQVREEVSRHIRETNVLETGRMFVGTSSEVNPPIKAENFFAMVETVGSMRRY